VSNKFIIDIVNHFNSKLLESGAAEALVVAGPTPPPNNPHTLFPIVYNLVPAAYAVSL
jgi:hypothetical protein